MSLYYVLINIVHICTHYIGSIAFLRAVNDPPMKPVFQDLHYNYHIATDELLGSWCFVFATLPFIPYSLLYIQSDSNNYIYYCLLIAAVFSVFGAFVFLLNCYPSEEVSTSVA